MCDGSWLVTSGCLATPSRILKQLYDLILLQTESETLHLQEMQDDKNACLLNRTQKTEHACPQFYLPLCVQV